MKRIKNNLWLGVLLIIITTLCVAFGQIVWKYSLNNYIGYMQWSGIFFGLVLYGIGSLFMILGLQKGELSKLHPVMSLKFVWVFIMGVLFLQEQIHWLKIVGIIAIFIGVNFLVKK